MTEVMEKALEKTIKANKNVQDVEKQLFDVVVLKARSPKTGFRAPQKTFGIWKTDGGDCLGVVGPGTVPTQPRFLFNTVLNTVYNSPDAFDLSTLKFNVRNMETEAARIEFSVEIPEVFEVPSKIKKGDKVKMTLLFSTSYSNQQSNRIDLYTDWCVCDNGSIRKFKASSLSIKNTKTAEDTIEKYFYDIGKIMEEVDRYKEDMLLLAGTKVHDKDVERIICKAFFMEPDAEKRSKRQQNKYDEVKESINLELDRRGKTAFGLYQGMTHYINHKMAVGKNKDYLVTGTGAERTARAEKLVLELAN